MTRPVRATFTIALLVALAYGMFRGGDYLWRVVLPHMVQTDAAMARRTGNPIPVMVTVAQVGDLKETLGATGTVVPADYVNLTSRIAARVETVTVNIGDIVQPGRVLVRFETESLLSAVGSSAAEVVRATADRERTAMQLDRLKGVFNQGFLTITEVEKAQAEFDAATAVLEAAKAKRAETSRSLSYSAVVSPVAGVVTQRLVNPGETPGPGAGLLVLGRMNPALVAAQISEEHLGVVSIGQAATVTFSAFVNEDFQGKVVRVDPTANSETKTFQVFVELKNPNLRLKSGLTAFVRLERRHPGALVVPSVALIYPAGTRDSALFVVENDRARLKRVKVGGVGDGRTAVVEGLREGEKVVTVGQLNLRDGDRVRLGNDHDENLDASPEPQPTPTKPARSGAR